jgi:hypothetical protein
VVVAVELCALFGAGASPLAAPVGSAEFGLADVGILLSATVAPAIAEFLRKVRLEVDTSLYLWIFREGLLYHRRGRITNGNNPLPGSKSSTKMMSQC